MASTWIPARIDMMRTLAAGGKSASQIAAEMSEKFGTPITRNAIIGQSYRNKIALNGKNVGGRRRVKNPAAPEATKTERRDIAVAAVQEQLPPPPAPPPEPKIIPLPQSQRVTLIELREGSCRWPMGDPRSEDFRFCGAMKPIDGKPYCAHHAAIAYVPAAARRVTLASTKEKQRFASIRNHSMPFRKSARA